MTQEKVLKTLESLGLADFEAKVYIFLAKKGPIKAIDAAKGLKTSKQRLYPILKKLQSKGIVNSTLEHPAKFSVVQFEKVLDSFLKARMEQTKRLQQDKDKILSDWNSIAIPESDSLTPKFTVIEGRSHIYSKIQLMIQDTEEEFSFVATISNLVYADQYGLFDVAFNHPLKSKIRFRFLSGLTAQNVDAMKALLKRIPKANSIIRGRIPNLGLELCPRMVIKDEAETLFFIDQKDGTSANEQDDVCLWTNCKSLVRGFSAIFEDFWRNAQDINKKIDEIEASKPALKKNIISDAKTAYKKYLEVLHSAKEEIIITTSPKGLFDYWNNMHLVKQCAERGVEVKIMVPIEGENIEVVHQLLKFCEIRNVSPFNQETTIIDGKQLFQLKKSQADKERHEESETYTCFKDAFHTDDQRYVEKMKNRLNNIWKASYVPSIHPLEEITRLQTNAKMIRSMVDSISPKESNEELERIVGLNRIRLTLNRKLKMDVDERIDSKQTRKLVQKIIFDVELAIEDEPALIGEAICEREVTIVVPQKQVQNVILQDRYEFSFPEGRGFKGNAFMILKNDLNETFFERSKAYASFRGTGEFEGQTINIGHSWRPFNYPVVWTGYLLKPLK
jgi:sugar-specific transcriptional regulator TrmB